VCEGDVYVAVPGARAHGADFAAAAREQGAVAAVTDEAGAASCRSAGLMTVVVPDPRALAGPLADVVYEHPSSSLTVIGITGTNGKTTMSYLVDSALRAGGRTTGLMGTTGHRVAGTYLPSQRTTPEAPEVHALLAHMRQSGVDTVVMEVSSHALEFGRVTGVDFDLAVFTNLSQDHLDFHRTMDAYFEAKARLFQAAGAGLACVDDVWGKRLVGRYPASLTYGLSGDAEWHARGLQPDGDGTRYSLVGPEGVRDASVRLPGDHNVVNAVGAVAAAVAVGVPVQAAIDGVARCAGVPGRMQWAGDATVRAYVDYAHTPDAVARALSAVTGPITAVLGCGGDRDAAKRPLMGQVAARRADVLVVTDDNPRSEDPAAIRAAIIEGAMSVPSGERALVLEVGDRGRAIGAAIDRTPVGGVVLVLGKGHEQGQEIAGHVHPFDDVAAVQAALAERAR
jgi:UDP-N-acetylmuramoyl-L-alanyl-D-glutamate--2,6-diaminopimelate ligase